MTQRFCHNCQIFLETNDERCWKCSQITEVLGHIEPSISSLNAQNTHLNSVSESTFTGQNNSQSVTGIKVAPIEDTRINQNNFRKTSDTGIDHSTDLFPKFERPKVAQTLNPHGRIIEATPFKVHHRDLPDTTFEKPKFRTFALPLIAVLIAVVVVGYGVNYARNYFAAMPEQRVDQLMAAKYAYEKGVNVAPQPIHPQSEKQTPWFSGWFRSQPTADEVFEKFESMTNAKAENSQFQTAVIKAKAVVSIPQAELDATAIDLKRNTVSNAFPESGEIHGMNVPEHGLWSFNMDMEMSMKTPDKAFFSMEMTPKNQQIKNVRINVFGGFNGQEKWALAKSLINGNETQKEGDADSMPPVFSKKDNFLTVSFSKNMYQTIEYSGIQTAMNLKNYVIKATKPNGKIDLLYFDIDTGLVNKYVGDSGDTYILGYNVFEGVLTPSIIMQKVGPSLIKMTITDIKKDIPLEDSIFNKSDHQ